MCDSAGTKFYQLRTDDTCARIARLNSISIFQLYNWNPNVSVQMFLSYVEVSLCLIRGTTSWTATTPMVGRDTTYALVCSRHHCAPWNYKHHMACHPTYKYSRTLWRTVFSSSYFLYIHILFDPNMLRFEKASLSQPARLSPHVHPTRQRVNPVLMADVVGIEEGMWHSLQKENINTLTRSTRWASAITLS